MSNPSKNIPTATRLNTFRCSRVTGSRSSRAPTLIADTFVSSVLVAGLADDRDALDFDQHARIGETRNRDRCACWEVLAEYFGSDFSHSRRVAGIGEENGHRDNVLHRSSSLLQGGFDILEGLPHLRVEVAGERIAS